MTLSALVLWAFVAGAVGVVVVWVAMPVLRGDVPAEEAYGAELELLARREAILQLLRDVEADRTAGRLAPGDYERLRAEIVADGARVLAELDRLAEAREREAEQRLEEIEAEIARRVEGGSE